MSAAGAGTVRSVERTMPAAATTTSALDDESRR